MLEARRHPKPLRGRVVKVCPSVSYAAWAELKGEVQWAQRRASIGTTILHSGPFLVVGSAGSGALRIRETRALMGVTTKKYTARATRRNDKAAVVKSPTRNSAARRVKPRTE